MLTFTLIAWLGITDFTLVMVVVVIMMRVMTTVPKSQQGMIPGITDGKRLRNLPISSELVEPQSKSLGCSVAGVHQAVTALDEGWDDHEVED